MSSIADKLVTKGTLHTSPRTARCQEENITGRDCRSIHPSVKQFEWHRWFYSYQIIDRRRNDGHPLISPLKSSCISYLKSCRLDKVKLVHDSVVPTLQARRSIPNSDEYLPSPESYLKENMYIVAMDRLLIHSLSMIL
jgi:hypothetical protein